MRLLLADDEDDQSIHIEVFEALRYLLWKRIQLRKPITYVDATNLKRSHRAPFIKLAKLGGCAVEALFFDAPLEVCLLRNSSRRRSVPDDVLREMAANLEAPSEDEGFERIVRVGAPAPRT